ncbi:NIF3-like protein 1 [Amphibalanus amphitrite]|uniref:NIF3-like protein 1 n=1 Tax=Amphibalanus amphitrite TaxID=1232801 RepID=UPI001C91099B|nr:NIF3-like protein 1 [Amphibalanus amphitrite]
MAGQPARLGLQLPEVISRLELFAPSRLAEKWDNVGLLVEPSPPKLVQRMLLTNDLTEDVMAEAVQRKVDLILSYHPPIFRPLKRLAFSKSWKERIAITCVENRIAVYSPHTCYDALDGGVNDWLCEAFGPARVTPLTPSLAPEPSVQLAVALPAGPQRQLDWVDDLHELCRQLPGASVEARYQDVVLDVRTLGSPLTSGPQPRLQLVVSTPRRHLATLTAFLGSAGLTSAATRLTTAEQLPEPSRGTGRLAELENKLSLSEAVQAIKKHLKLQHVRLAEAVGKPKDSPVRTVAVCAGSGGSVLAGQQADLLLTGEMSHHEVLDATHAGSHVVLCEHSNTERGFLARLAGRLEALLAEQVELVTSEADRDPLTVV